MRKCSGCRTNKPDSDFLSKKGGGEVLTCIGCRDKSHLAAKRWQQKNRALHNRNQKFRKFGITEADYQVLLERFEGGCAICKEPSGVKAFAIDHCHTTNRVRGLLCFNCNTGLGKFKDDPDLLQKAIEYLRTSES